MGEAKAKNADLCNRSRLLNLLERSGRLRVTVMGIGRFGGSIGAATYFGARGDLVTVTDLKPDTKLACARSYLQDYPIIWRLGGHDAEDFENADLIVASPAVPRANRFLAAAAAAGVPITSEMNIFLSLCRAPIAAVTGSNGKSTTTALLMDMLSRGTRTCLLGGNIGCSLLPVVHRIRPADQVVLELSSFQLEDAAAIEFSPHAAVLTNLTPNHLDRHGTFEAYCEAKKSIIRWQGRDDVAVLNADCPNSRAWRGDVRGRLCEFSLEDVVPAGGHFSDGDLMIADGQGARMRLPVPSSFRLKGRHNIANALAAACAALSLGLPARAVVDSLAEFEPLEHRLEFVAQCGGVAFYNDSIATTPESVIAAIGSFSARPITLIAGGYDKHIPFDDLAHEIARGVEVLVTIGQTGPTIAELVRQATAAAGVAGPHVLAAASLQEAVEAALAHSRPGAVCLLSPACASYDMFENFEQRGQLFKEHVHSLARRVA